MDIEPKDCINMRIRLLSRAINRIFDRHTRKLGTSTSQQTILLLVNQIEDIKQNQIGKQLLLERSTVTRELNGLIEKGLIRKIPDGISPLVVLTEKGTQFIVKLLPVWRAANAEAASLLGPGGVGALGSIFQKLKA